MRYTVILEPEPDGGYSVHLPALPGCSAQGETVEEALASVVGGAQDALSVWVEEGTAPPQDNAEIVADELAEVLLARAEDGLPLTVETREVEVAEPAVPNGRTLAPAPPDNIPVILTVPEDPRQGQVKRGALRAFIRHSGMSPDEFMDYVGQESDQLDRGH